jgi:hypothetical protein
MRLLSLNLAPLCTRWNDWTHFYSVWPIPGAAGHVLLFEICLAQCLFGLYFSKGEFAVCLGPIEVTILEMGDWCDEL